jgi:deazaflavin-dependent oxidoreductase (nitroreductase family)
METAYRPTLPKRILNRIMRLWIRFGLPPGKYYVLTVRGRRSGRLRFTPVSVMGINGQRWLVAPYGPRDWVKNARAAGQVTLRRGGRTEVVAVQEEHDPARCAPVLKLYLKEEPITRRFFDAKTGSPLEDFAAEAHRHPVFRIQELDEDP